MNTIIAGRFDEQARAESGRKATLPKAYGMTSIH